MAVRRVAPDPGAGTALDHVRGRAPTIRPNVRRLAAFASVHSCPTAAVAFAARVDDKVVIFESVHAHLPCSFWHTTNVLYANRLRLKASREYRVASRIL